MSEGEGEVGSPMGLSVENSAWEEMFSPPAVRDSTSLIIFFFPLFYFWFWKRKSFFLPSTFSEYTGTRYSSFLSTVLIWITSSK